MLRKQTDLTLTEVGAVTSCHHTNVLYAEQTHDGNLMREDYRRFFSKAMMVYEMEKSKASMEAFEKSDYLMMLAEIKHLQLINKEQEKQISRLSDDLERLEFYKTKWMSVKDMVS